LFKVVGAKEWRTLTEQILGKDGLVRLMDKRYQKLPEALKQLIKSGRIRD
jgi:hypothetical protein